MKYIIVAYQDEVGFGRLPDCVFKNSNDAIARATEYAEKDKREHLVIEIPPAGRRKVIAVLRPKQERYNLKIHFAGAGE